MSKLLDPGYIEGDTCNRNGCAGIIAQHTRKGCSCHISPPCSACTTPRGYCSVCEWEEANEERINDYLVQVDRKTQTYKSFVLRPLDSTKVEWHSKNHTHFSMIKEGVYPEGTTQAEVLKLVNGTFGGRFTHFGDGKFKFIAYTD